MFIKKRKDFDFNSKLVCPKTFFHPGTQPNREHTDLRDVCFLCSCIYCLYFPRLVRVVVVGDTWKNA